MLQGSVTKVIKGLTEIRSLIQEFLMTFFLKVNLVAHVNNLTL